MVGGVILHRPRLEELCLGDYLGAQWRLVHDHGITELPEQIDAPRHPYECVERTDDLLERIKRELDERGKLGQLELWEDLVASS